jgi:hypothetical protein
MRKKESAAAPASQSFHLLPVDPNQQRSRVSRSTGSFSKPSRTHTSATLEPRHAIFTGSRKRGPRSASRSAWWGRPSKETTSAGQALVSLYIRIAFLNPSRSLETNSASVPPSQHPSPWVIPPLCKSDFGFGFCILEFTFCGDLIWLTFRWLVLLGLRSEDQDRDQR